MAGCLMVVMIPLFKILQGGTRGSLSGIMQVETAMEAERILKQVHSDLKNACFETGDGAIQINLWSMIKESGTAREPTYVFSFFPVHANVKDIVVETPNGFSHRFVNRVTYKVLSDPHSKIGYKLVREEKFHPRLGGTIESRVLSEKLNFFQIQPIEIQTTKGRNQYFFQVTLQLIDSYTSVPTGFSTNISRSSGIVMADFTDIVYPEFWKSLWNQEFIGRNWHSGIEGPP
ncbi:MAG: hypothetical protein HQM08_00545 [Candidatus Riflebacteria bacterium]|nr:hypothetical protein [Candidatus Riflebacteria bacterium]